MKRSAILGLAVSVALATGAWAQQVCVTTIPGYSVGGAEFNVAPVIGTGYAPSVIVNNGFETFCADREVNIFLPWCYNYTVNVNGTITQGTAWLYSQFARGTLAGYRYGGFGTPDAGNPLVTERESDAFILQLAIWYLEGTYDGGYSQNPFVNPFLFQVAEAFGGGVAGLAAAMEPNVPGGFGVGELDLSYADGTPAQPMLVLLPCTPPDCTLIVPNPLPSCGSPNNQLSGAPGMAAYAWSIIASTGPGWAITSGADQQTITYTSGSSGTATFQLIITDANGCTATCQVTFGCTADSGGCRVTGGSNKQLNSRQSACIKTPVPTFVSHGGQVGASHSGETEFTPYSTCISGEWQHNRHLRKNSLVGTFHAAGNGNKHQFDSLLCACLPCDDTPGAVGRVGEICHPGDRICGPAPRRAPANKICFSGVGDYTFTTGKKTVKAVFRVDIEDRSEGNSHASQPPPDRYRIRIWLLDPACGRGFSPDSAQGLALRYAVSADASKIASLATTEDLKLPAVAGAPDIDDGGDMTQGNHQIHPETGSTCQ